MFDVLETERDGDLRRRPLRERRGVRERLFRKIPPRSPLTLAMQTSDPAVAEEWYDTMAVAGIEGLVIKAANSPYLPGSRLWMKYKSRQTTDAVIGGVTGSLHDGMTPACAGTTRRWPTGFAGAADDLRLCGDDDGTSTRALHFEG